MTPAEALAYAEDELVAAVAEHARYSGDLRGSGLSSTDVSSGRQAALGSAERWALVVSALRPRISLTTNVVAQTVGTTGDEPSST